MPRSALDGTQDGPVGPVSASPPGAQTQRFGPRIVVVSVATIRASA